MAPAGLLLSNLGSPAAPRRGEVAAYLRQFLTDPDVIDLPRIPREILVRGIVVPLRASRSARAYAKVWTPEGSPLLVHSRGLASGVARALGEGWKVALGMRYGEPSIGHALEELLAAGCDPIVALPLYPQMAGATTGSTRREIDRQLANRPAAARLVHARPFFREEGFLRAFEANIRATLEREPRSHLVISFHGLPERQVRKADPEGRCLVAEDCCRHDASLERCYRAQCLWTASALASRLGLTRERWTASFQSRLGRDPWLGPTTVETVEDLLDRGIRRIAVAAPSFVADCLETLEELGHGLAGRVESRGGRLHVVPCPNADEDWIRTVAQIALSYLPPSR